MNYFTKLSALAVFAAFTSLSAAQFVVSGVGPFNSWGYEGDPNNFSANVTVNQPSHLFGNFQFEGDLTAVAPGTFISDSGWTINNTTLNGGFAFTGTGNAYTSAHVSVGGGGLFWINQNDNLHFEANQLSDNDPVGNDAFWNNVSFTWSGAPVVTNIGVYNAANPFSFTTAGSDFDTEIALFDAKGKLIGMNDDVSPSNLTSALNFATLAGGTYYVTATGYQAYFDNGIALGGFTEGNLKVNVNGSNVFTGAQVGDALHTFSFTVVPEPASIAAVGLGLALLVRRRKK